MAEYVLEQKSMVTSLFVACKGEVVSDGLLLSALALALPTAETIKAGVFR